jgi:hypothetical protein
MGRTHDQHDRSSALAALTVSPTRQPMGWSLRWQPYNLKAVDGAEFLRPWWRPLRGPVVRPRDRGSLQQGAAIDVVCQAYPRLPLAEFPAYAPELQPTAQVWNEFTGHLAHSLRRDTRHLCERVRAHTRRLRRAQAKWRSCILASELPSPPRKP